MNTRSLRFRLMAWYAGVVAGVFVLLGALLYGGLRVYLEQSLARAQVRRAQQIADTLLAKIDQTGEAHVVSEINSWFAPETNDRFIRITRADGSVLYLSKSPKDMSFDAGQIPARPKPAAADSWRKTTSGNHPMLIASVTCKSASDRILWSKSARRWSRSRPCCSG